MGYNVANQGLHLKLIIDEKIISKLVVEKLQKIWGWFAGSIGIFCEWIIIMIC